VNRQIPLSPGGERRVSSYSPGRRTALVLCGSGAHGAYLSGVLRAIQESGIKIDLVAGHGFGAACAALAAIDGGGRLWDADGLWHSPSTASLYGWKPWLRIAGWLVALLLIVFLIPIFVLAFGLLVYPAGFLLTLIGLEAGAGIIAWYSGWLQSMFASENLPTLVPRLAMVVVAALALVGAGAAAVARWQMPVRRRTGSGWWWQLVGAPIDAAGAQSWLTSALWQLIRGAATTDRPAPGAVGRRYAEVVAENLGQPGFREMLAVATDLDARRDIVVALLAEPYRSAFLAPRPGRDRRAEVVDVTGPGRDHALDVVLASMTPPVGCDPALVTFSRDSFWRGETHRLCDRPAVARLLEEVSAAGATQVIVASAVASTHEPHHLSAPLLDPRHRLSEYVAAAEGGALRDALESARGRFDSLYVVCPIHNPIGPFDLRGVYDEASDRHQDIPELMAHGYEDAYRQFIEPVVGASGEQLTRADTSTLRMTT
jgi:hypothetical protein